MPSTGFAFQFFHLSELPEDQIFGDLLGAELNVTLSCSPARVTSTCVNRFEASGTHLWPAKVRAAVLQPKAISGYFPAAVPKAPKTQLQTYFDSHSCVLESEKHIYKTG